MPITPTSRRRGSIYLLVLVTVSTVTVLGLASLSVVSSRRLESESVGSVMDARAAAESAIDLALAIMNENPDWRWSLPNGNWRSDAPLGAAAYTINVVDPDDGDMANGVLHPVLLTGEGRSARARSVVRVRLEPEGPFEGAFAGIIEALSPLSYWRLADTSGSKAADVTGHRTGDYRNGVTLARRTSLGATLVPAFDGTNDFVEIDHGAKFEVTQGTITFWFRADRTGQRAGVFSKDATGFVDGGHLDIYVRNDRLWADFSSKTDMYTLSTPKIQANTWYFGVFTFGAGTQLYLNGSLVASSPVSHAMDKNKEKIAIGVSLASSAKGSVSPWTDPFPGSICEVAFFGTQFTETDVADLYAAYPPPLRMRIVSTSWERIAD
ncbi:MAG: LamG domain-containing protein [Phycisphaeraceae bacterium]|nr:LamG domain-containing protein [Phycisphaeraceae bacterium]